MSDEDIDREAVLMRAYGNQTEIIIDRESAQKLSNASTESYKINQARN
jgi:hypothetical protein